MVIHTKKINHLLIKHSPVIRVDRLLGMVKAHISKDRIRRHWRRTRSRTPLNRRTIKLNLPSRLTTRRCTATSSRASTIPDSFMILKQAIIKLANNSSRLMAPVAVTN